MAKPTPLSLMTIRDVAEHLKCSAATVQRRIKAGKLRAIVDGRLVRIAPEDLENFIRTSRRWR